MAVIIFTFRSTTASTVPVIPGYSFKINKYLYNPSGTDSNNNIKFYMGYYNCN